MNPKILVAALLTLVVQTVSAQWSAQTSPTQSNIYDIHFNSNNVGFLAGDYAVYRTLDGGNTWAQSNFTGTELELSILYNAYIHDIHFLDNQNGFITGGGFFNAYDIIARTTDGGANWSLVYSTPVSGTVFRESMNSVTFVNTTTGFAVGGQGRVLKTINSGTTWSEINLSTNQTLQVVYFLDSQNGFIGGKSLV